MKTRVLKLMVFLVILTLVRVQHVDALMVETHQAINDQVAKTPINGFNLDGYLKTNLGMVHGINTLLINGGQSTILRRNLPPRPRVIGWNEFKPYRILTDKLMFDAFSP
jgi:hypothetical protein